jgi:uncharacterized RDD family membrane protein YckC
MENSKYANWLPRLAASIIDILILAVPISLASIPLNNLILSDLVLSDNYNLIKTAINLLKLTICIVYFTILLPKNGETPGYKFLGLKIIKEDGRYLTAGEAALRALIHGIPVMILVDSVMILVTEKRQGAHDMAVGSICVKEDEKESRAKWIVGLSCGIICLLIPYLLYLFIKWFIFRLP